MGEVLQFRSKRLSGFIPELPEPFASNHAEIRGELSSLISDRAYAAFPAKWPNSEPIIDDRDCSEINPDGVA